MPIKETSLPTLQLTGPAPTRLYALSVHDRDDPSRSLGHVIVEESETRIEDRDGVVEARLQLKFELITDHGEWRDGDSSFGGCYSRYSNAVNLIGPSIGSDGLFNDLPRLRGHRVGTFLFSRVVTWAKRWAAAEVVQVKLGGDTSTGNTTRRDRLYEQAGLRFMFTESNGRQILASTSMTASELKVVTTWGKNITVVGLPEYIGRLRSTNKALHNDVDRLERVRKELQQESDRRERTPIRWAIGQVFIRLWWQLTSPKGFLIIVLVTIGLGWMIHERTH